MAMSREQRDEQAKAHQHVAEHTVQDKPVPLTSPADAEIADEQLAQLAGGSGQVIKDPSDTITEGERGL